MKIKTLKTKNGRPIDWYLIENPSDKEQAELIAQGENCYANLFNDDQFREEYDNFKKYAEESSLARRNLKTCKMVDSWYLGVVNGKVIGFVFFTLYPKDGLGVISYMGARAYGETIETLINEETRELFPGDTFEAFIFELEKAFPPKSAKGQRCTANDQRRALTYRYQETGAWKVSWIWYRQPKLSKDKNFPDPEMHLMYWPTSKQRQANLSNEIFSVEQVEKIVKFMYLTFYLDGFNAVGSETDISYWKDKLQNIYFDAVSDLESSVRFHKIFTKSNPPYVFISYPHEGKGIAKARKINMYLADYCIDSFFWSKDNKENLGNDIDKTIEKKFEEAGAVVYLLTPETHKADGQKKEIAYLKKYKKEKIFIISYVKQREIEYLGLPVKSENGERAIIYGYVEIEDDFVRLIDSIIDNLTIVQRQQVENNNKASGLQVPD